MTDVKALAPQSIVVCDRNSSYASSIEQFLRTRGIEARWIAPRNIDDVDRELSARRVGHVILPNLDVLLRAAYREEITLDAWLAPYVIVDILSLPQSPARPLLLDLAHAWHTHLQQRRRQRTIAGALLSVIAMALAFVLLWLSR